MSAAELPEHGDAWLKHVREWIVEAVGSRVDLEIIRERAWGTIVRVTTPAGVLFFKEPATAGRHESTIVDDIAHRWPGLVPEVIAADAEGNLTLLLEDQANRTFSVVRRWPLGGRLLEQGTAGSRT